MPRIGELFGVFFYLYFQEHGIAHVHAIYQDYVAVISLDGLLLEGKLPKKKMKIARKFVVDYAELIQEMIDEIEGSKKGSKKSPKIENITKRK